MRCELVQKGEVQIDPKEELERYRDDECQHQQHHQYSQPAQPVTRLNAFTVALDVLCELGPVFFAFGASKGLEALEPLFFVEAEAAAVAANDAAIEDSAGELGVGVLFEGAKVARSHLGGLGDRLQRHLALQALLLQIGSEGHENLRQPTVPVGLAYDRSLIAARGVPPQRCRGMPDQPMHARMPCRAVFVFVEMNGPVRIGEHDAVPGKVVAIA
jgi:hypothetical protein